MATFLAFSLLVASLLCAVGEPGAHAQVCSPDTFAVGQGNNVLLSLNSTGLFGCGGTNICTSLAAAGDITAVSAGTGLSGGGSSGLVTLAVDSTYVQRRVTGTCSGTSALQSISSTGSATCLNTFWSPVSGTSNIEYNSGNVYLGSFVGTRTGTLSAARSASTTAAVEGYGATSTNGFLGVFPATSSFQGTPLLAYSEVGVLGVATDSGSSDNFGVYGYSSGVGVRGAHTSGNVGSLGTAAAGIEANSARITGLTVTASLQTSTLQANGVPFSPLAHGYVSTTGTCSGGGCVGATVTRTSTGVYRIAKSGITLTSTVILTPYQAGTTSLETCQYVASTGYVDVNCVGLTSGSSTISPKDTVFSFLIMRSS